MGVLNALYITYFDYFIFEVLYILVNLAVHFSLFKFNLRRCYSVSDDGHGAVGWTVMIWWMYNIIEVLLLICRLSGY